MRTSNFINLNSYCRFNSGTFLIVRNSGLQQSVGLLQGNQMSAMIKLGFFFIFISSQNHDFIKASLFDFATFSKSIIHYSFHFQQKTE
uniref:Uncharacterized protein n=1 Tax=Heterorhabditis bacteriophora TaxID=37862 RepID=A0A1I7X1W8_HETBA